MENLIFQLSHHQHHKSSPPAIDCREIADHTVSKFKKVISVLNRAGHARFRRSPRDPPSVGNNSYTAASSRQHAAHASDGNSHSSGTQPDA
ncbi:hypothetical protein HPP92_016805 [Vanilla planifolia]|uniref:Uncharacterized protein n=1 Tax=Vanilla planifolia TaxID=51239 RepID=A0A835QCS0_VANPL|nr:hypothetical protein HPP92_017435 [Vanilla planifolia]KAG0472259.1 hypothetical protein HPP92_016805 [Vanilla planifolia]